MVGGYLSIVAVKDVLLTRIEKNGHGAIERQWLEAGQGVVDWTAVAEVLAARGFDGPISVHCEFETTPEERDAAIKREVSFFRRFWPA
jgi:sugar phosphate isomerase/epimerase